MASSTSSGGAGWISPEEFQTLLKERKAERKEMVQRKREEGLRSIADMNAVIQLTGLLLLPSEIWQMILLYLDDPNDLWSIYNSHTFFQGVMETTKIQYMLFPLAVRDMDRFLLEDKNSLRSRLKSTPTLTQIRNLSRSLQKAVDDVVKQNLLKNLGFEYYFLYESDVSLHFKHSESNDGLEELDQVMMKAGLPHTNFNLKTIHVEVLKKPPFIGPSEWDFGTKITFLLEIVGFQIKNFKFKINWKNFDFDALWNDEEQLGFIRQFYISLRQWTFLMPNLERLHIEIWTSFRKEKKKAAAVKVKSLLTQNPFPTLEFLEIFSFKTIPLTCIPAVEIVGAILSSNTHVKKISFKPDNWELFQSLSPNLLESMNLSALTSFPLEWPFISNGKNVIERVMRADNKYHLTRLDLSVNLGSRSINEVFEFLQNFPKLQILRLFVVKPEFGNDVIQKISMTNLNEFTCRLCDPNISFDGQPGCLSSFFTFQFLVHSKRLRTIDVAVTISSSSEESLCLQKLKFHLEGQHYDGTIDFWDPRRNLDKSNIWDVFPQLEQVKVIGRTRTFMDVKEVVISKECRRSGRNMPK